jgi:predicted nucleic acid-binding protein
VATDPQLDRVFVDASFIVATYNRRDQYHERARRIDASLEQAAQIWTTDAVLLEVAATLAQPSLKIAAFRVWKQFHGGDKRCRAVEASAANLQDAMQLFRSRADKAWSLADCLSFLVMQREGLTDALTADQHFAQAGFRAILLL